MNAQMGSAVDAALARSVSISSKAAPHVQKSTLEKHAIFEVSLYELMD
jgi:hypothetical protein